MSFQRVNDVLGTIREYHAQAAIYYHHLYRNSEGKRMRMLLSYLVAREMEMVKMMNAFHAEVSPGIRQRWMQFAPPSVMQGKLWPGRTRKVHSPQELLAISGEIDAALINYSQTLAGMARKPDVRAVFQSMCQKIMQKRREVVFNNQFLASI